jgi:hypothetical protein
MCFVSVVIYLYLAQLKVHIVCEESYVRAVLCTRDTVSPFSDMSEPHMSCICLRRLMESYSIVCRSMLVDKAACISFQVS